VHSKDISLFFVCKESINDSISYGIAVSKKKNKKAVIRNRVKRLVRVCVKDFFKCYSDDVPSIQFIVVWKKSLDNINSINLKLISPELQRLIIQMIAKCKKVKGEL